MADDSHDSEPPRWPAPGWYPDPGAPQHQRYWTGDSWAPMAYPAPGGFAPEPPGPAPGAAPPWANPDDPAPTAWWPAPAVPGSVPPGQRPGLSGAGLVMLLVAVFVLVATASAAIVAGTHHGRSSATPGRSGSPSGQPGASAPAARGPTTTGPVDPAAGVLSIAVLGQGDLPPGTPLDVIPGGDQVRGTSTLDLCNGAFPSESLRTARLQVAASDAQGIPSLSTEAVLYKDAAATSQAFAELRRAAATCPSTPVVSPVGEPTVTTHFKPPPDGAWPQVAGVDRLAYEFVATDASGQSTHDIAVYLRRGRLLEGVYFQAPDDAQLSVDGQTSIPGIVNVLATRIAKLPNSQVV